VFNIGKTFKIFFPRTTEPEKNQIDVKASHHIAETLVCEIRVSQAYRKGSHSYSWRKFLVDWFGVYRFTSCSRTFHLYGDVTTTGEGLQKFRPMLGAQGL
jgi:hypothetical protein